MRAYIMENKHVTIFFVILSFCYTIFFISFALAHKPLPECPPDDGMFRESPGINASMWENTNPEPLAAESSSLDECTDKLKKRCKEWRENYKKYEKRYDSAKPPGKQRYIVGRLNNFSYHYNENCPKKCPGLFEKLPPQIAIP
jgi:hypothetical protein